MTDKINQSQIRKDPASKHTFDPNDRPDGQTKQPGGHEDRPSDPQHVRDAGPDRMKNPPRKWTKEDEESDQSFPASDPPANY